MEEPVYKEDDLKILVKLHFEEGSLPIDIRIVKWKDSTYMVPMDFEGQAGKIEQLAKNNKPLFVIDMGDNRKIYYEDGLVTYTITTRYSMNQTITFVNDLQ